MASLNGDSQSENCNRKYDPLLNQMGKQMETIVTEDNDNQHEEEDINNWKLLKLIMGKDSNDAKVLLKKYPKLAEYKLSNDKRIDEVFDCDAWKDIDGNFFKCHKDLTPLHVAAVYDCDEIANEILNENSALCEKETKGGNPLHYAANSNGHKVAKLLMMKNNSLAEKYGNKEGYYGGLTPLHYAAVNDSFEVAKLILANCPNAWKMIPPNHRITPLHMAAHSNSSKVVKLLLSMPEIDVNCQDSEDNTPLHYAAYLNLSNIVDMLLDKGAMLTLKNVDGEVAQISAEILKVFLDKKLIIKEDQIKKIDQAVFDIKIDYSFLKYESIDTKSDKRHLIDDANLVTYNKINLEESSEDQDPFVESELVWQLSEFSEKHEELLKHPVIKTFLEMKWSRVQGFFFFGLAYKLIFLIFLYTLIFYDYGGSVMRSDVDHIGTNITKSIKKTPDTGSVVLSWLVGLTLLPLIFMEVLQVVLSVPIYFTSPINYLQLFNIGVSVWLALDGSPELWDVRRHFAAIILVFSVIEWIDFLGTHPTISPMVKMFYQVTRTFFNYLMLYGWVIASFGCSFYLIFHTDEKGGQTEEENIFNSTKLFSKTFVMFVGEIDYGSMPFQLGIISIIQYILFLLFLFMITVVLNNLMNGLAVSDTGKILENAEIVALKEQAYLFTFWESFILGNPNKFLRVSLGCLTGKLPFLKKIFLLNCVFESCIVVHPNPKKNGTLSQPASHCSLFTPGTYFIQENIQLSSRHNGGVSLYVSRKTVEQLKMNILESHKRKVREKEEEEDKKKMDICEREKTEILLKRMESMISTLR